MRWRRLVEPDQRATLGRCAICSAHMLQQEKWRMLRYAMRRRAEVYRLGTMEILPRRSSQASAISSSEVVSRVAISGQTAADG